MKKIPPRTPEQYDAVIAEIGRIKDSKEMLKAYDALLHCRYNQLVEEGIVPPIETVKTPRTMEEIMAAWQQSIERPRPEYKDPIFKKISDEKWHSESAIDRGKLVSFIRKTMEAEDVFWSDQHTWTERYV